MGSRSLAVLLVFAVFGTSSVLPAQSSQPKPQTNRTRPTRTNGIFLGGGNDSWNTIRGKSSKSSRKAKSKARKKPAAKKQSFR